VENRIFRGELLCSAKNVYLNATSEPRVKLHYKVFKGIDLFDQSYLAADHFEATNIFNLLRRRRR